MKPLPHGELIRLSRRSFIRGSTALITSSLLLPRKSRAWTHGGGGGGGYVAPAVHFDGNALLTCDSPTGSDSPYMNFSCWANSQYIAPTPPSVRQAISFFQVNKNTAGSTAFVHPNGLMEWDFQPDNVGSKFAFADTTAGFVTLNIWHNLLFNVDCSSDPPILNAYLDDAPISFADFLSGGLPFNLDTFNNNGFVMPDPFFGNIIPPIQDMADFWISTTAPLDFTVEANRRKFISATGKPVDPSGFPAAAFLFSGDATTFPVNQGTGGPFTLTGTLTNAPTSPSD